MKALHDFDPKIFLEFPSCPSNSSSTSSLPLGQKHFSTVVIYALWFLLSLTFFVITLLRFNHVNVFNRKIHEPLISNHFWILFYISVMIRGLLGLAFYLGDVDNAKDNSISAYLFQCNVAVLGISQAFLSLALHHQFKFRTASTYVKGQPNAPSRVAESKALLPSRGIENARSNSSVTAVSPPRIFSWDSTIWFLCFAYVILILMVDQFPSTLGNYVAIIIVLGLQQLAQLFLTALIVLRNQDHKEYTISKDEINQQRRTKLILVLATIFSLVNMMPPEVWQKLLPLDCPFRVASWMDLMLILDTLSLVFYFLFLKFEFERNKEELIWTTVNTIQETFGQFSFQTVGRAATENAAVVS